MTENITLSFNPQIPQRGGWTSEKTFRPEGMFSLNNNYYSFNIGVLYQHHSVNENPNTFYGITTPTSLTFVFNQDVSTVKNFKTLSIETEDQWNATIQTNVESGNVDASYFEDKEGKQFAWIRGDYNKHGADIDFKSENIFGVGAVDSISSSGDNPIVTFTKDVSTDINQSDVIYLVESNNGLYDGGPKVVGTVANVAGTSIEIIPAPSQDADGNEITPAEPAAGDFIFASKDNSVEKSGLIGYYAIVTLTNDSTDRVSLFAANTEVTRS